MGFSLVFRRRNFDVDALGNNAVFLTRFRLMMTIDGGGTELTQPGEVQLFFGRRRRISHPLMMKIGVDGFFFSPLFGT
jgi:hypothetical protein